MSIGVREKRRGNGMIANLHSSVLLILNIAPLSDVNRRLLVTVVTYTRSGREKRAKHWTFGMTFDEKRVAA